MQRFKLQGCLPLAVLTLIGAGVVPASAVSIDFDDGTAGHSIESFYSGLGLTFKKGSWSPSFDLLGTSGPLALWHTGLGSRPSAGDPIVGIFTSAMSTISIDTIEAGDNGARLDAFDAPVDGNLIASHTVFGSGFGDGTFQTLSVSAPNIWRFAVYQPQQISGDALFFDNLSFGAAPPPVPQPATGTVLSIGLCGLIGRWLRRRRPADVAA